MFSPFDFDVCTSPEEQEEAARRARAREGLRGTPGSARPSPAPAGEEIAETAAG